MVQGNPWAWFKAAEQLQTQLETRCSAAITCGGLPCHPNALDGPSQAPVAASGPERGVVKPLAARWVRLVSEFRTTYPAPK